MSIKLQPDYPAFPVSWGDKETGATFLMDGLTSRQYAAIQLRVPNSGTDWLDDMIREANARDFATQSRPSGFFFDSYKEIATLLNMPAPKTVNEKIEMSTIMEAKLRTMIYEALMAARKGGEA